jgi:AcrR family transcriptional regulator
VPKVSPEHLAARRRQILDGARSCFARHGYDGATVAKLEEEIGLSRGAIFNYFAGKQDLFAALAVDDNRRYVDLLVEEGLDGAMRSMANENPEWLGVVLEVQGRLRHDPQFVERLERDTVEDRDRIAAWFRDRQAEGVFRDDVDLMNLGRFATMLLNGLALRVAGGDPVEIEPVLTLLHDALDARQ